MSTTTRFAAGDRVKCCDARPHCHWLRLGHVYTVDVVAVDQVGDGPTRERIGLSTGPATMWDADQFVRVEPAQVDPAHRAYLDGEPRTPPAWSFAFQPPPAHQPQDLPTDRPLVYRPIGKAPVWE